jgi:hypothetical protein
MNIRPMTLGNMRSPRVRGALPTCTAGGHETAVNVDTWSDDVTVPSIGLGMPCGRCSNLGANALPNWREQSDRSPGGEQYRAAVPYRGLTQLYQFAEKKRIGSMRPT